MTNQESKLYEDRPVAEKYAILEAMRLELDRLYRENRQAYEKCRAAREYVGGSGGELEAVGSYT